MPARVESGYDLARLSLLSKTLFYARENHPEEIAPRARELLVGALAAVASQDSEIVIERDPNTPPRWVTVTVDGRPCTLDIVRVDAPWSLRTKLQEAMRFIQGNLGPAPGAESAQRLMRIEFAATNGMLSALDPRSALFDAQTYRIVRTHYRGQPDAIRADTSVVHGPAATGASGANATPAPPVFKRIAPGSPVGYLGLHSFSQGVSDEVERALSRLDAEGVKGLVLDLRDNGGGLLDEAVKVADAFIRSGSLASIVSKRGRKEAVAHDGGHEPDGPLVVLVNRQTAAGSELVAAAIKELGRGVVLGERTAGAGSIRAWFDLPNAFAPIGKVPAPPDPNDENLGLLLTTGRMLAAGGAEIERVGVQPDIQPICPANEQPRADDDCALRLAQDVVTRARDPRRATLLSTARSLVGDRSVQER